MKLKPKAILFDLDGVLVDSLDSWWLSLNTALKKFNHEELTREEFIEKFWGHDLYDNVTRLGLDDGLVDFCNLLYSEHVSAIKIYPDTKTTLEKLSPYPKVIITNTPRDCVHHILQKFDIERFFKFILTSNDVKKAKPHPEAVFKSCDLLGVKPNEAVLVGDTISDVKAGRDAGCPVIGIGVEADYTINRLSELTDIIEINV